MGGNEGKELTRLPFSYNLQNRDKGPSKYHMKSRQASESNSIKVLPVDYKLTQIQRCLRFVYLFKLLKVLSIELVINLRFKSSFHVVQSLPLDASEPWVCLKSTLLCLMASFRMHYMKWQLKNIFNMHTLISCAPLVPSLCSTLHKSLLIRSLTSGESIASSGNFK